MTRKGSHLLAVYCLVFFLVILTNLAHAQSTTCVGKFPDPISEICWSCVLPISIGSFTVAEYSQEDIPSQPSVPLCTCPPLAIGVTIGYWEPARAVDVTRKPFCLTYLDGIDMDPGIDAPHGQERRNHPSGALPNHAFYQAHYYMNPIFSWLELVDKNNKCFESNDFDLVYLTEVDPLWNDDEWSAILSPEVILFANSIAVSACAIDCVKATVGGFGFADMWWCSGCQGGLLPLTGNVSDHYSLASSSSLIMGRLLMKMHRENVAWGYTGPSALCGPYFMPVMDKTVYKYQMSFPIPQTKKILGRCCQPIGRTTALWGANKEFPFKGEDAAFTIYRKRNCCAY